LQQCPAGWSKSSCKVCMNLIPAVLRRNETSRTACLFKRGSAEPFTVAAITHYPQVCKERCLWLGIKSKQKYTISWFEAYGTLLVIVVKSRLRPTGTDYIRRY
jgi:predicted nucleic acid-binding Zn ribbon protein